MSRVNLYQPGTPQKSQNHIAISSRLCRDCAKATSWWLQRDVTESSQLGDKSLTKKSNRLPKLVSQVGSATSFSLETSFSSSFILKEVSLFFLAGLLDLGGVFGTPLSSFCWKDLRTMEKVQNTLTSTVFLFPILQLASKKWLQKKLDRQSIL